MATAAGTTEAADTAKHSLHTETLAAMSHNVVHTMDKEHGATASSLSDDPRAVALPLIFNALLEQSQSALVNYANAWGNWLAGFVDGEQVSRVVERVEASTATATAGGGADDEDRNEILITAVLAYASAHPVKGELTARVSLLPQDVSPTTTRTRTPTSPTPRPASCGN